MKNVNRTLDVKKMEKIGKSICNDYVPILELARASLNNDAVFSSNSIIKVHNNPDGKNSTEEMFLKHINYNEDDPAIEFFNMCRKIRQVDLQCEYFLIERYFYGKTDEDIIYSTFYGSKRLYYKVKKKAHYQVAYLTGNIYYR